MVDRRLDIYRWYGHHLVKGWLAPEVLRILAVFDTTQRARSVSGAVAEIGVHHGRLFIGLDLLQRDDERSVAIDIFGDQQLNIDTSGRGDLARFRKNIGRWSSLDKLVIHQGDSTKMSATKLRELAGADIRLFSVDGGHTDSIVFSDMTLAEAALAPGGIVIADDVFNEQWPDVASGTQRYLQQGGRLTPFAIGFNKVFFAMPDYADYYRAALTARFDDNYLIFVKSSHYMTHQVLVLARTPRRPGALFAQNPTAKKIYRRRLAKQGIPY